MPAMEMRCGPKRKHDGENEMEIPANVSVRPLMSGHETIHFLHQRKVAGLGDPRTSNTAQVPAKKMPSPVKPWMYYLRRSSELNHFNCTTPRSKGFGASQTFEYTPCPKMRHKKEREGDRICSSLAVNGRPAVKTTLWVVDS